MTSFDPLAGFGPLPGDKPPPPPFPGMDTSNQPPSPPTKPSHGDIIGVTPMTEGLAADGPLGAASTKVVGSEAALFPFLKIFEGKTKRDSTVEEYVLKPP